MLCPNCKTELINGSLKCSNCGARTGRICPNCKTRNLVTAHTCKNCSFELLKTCPNCGAANDGKSKTCRRCGVSFSKNIEKSKPASDTDNESLPKYETVQYTQKEAKDRLKEALSNPNKKIIALQGESGIGKSTVIRLAASEFNNSSNSNTVWLSGRCTPHTKLTPFGYVQDVLLNLLNLNNFCINLENLTKESQEFFKQDFTDMSNSEILDFINFLYPAKYGEFKNIYSNKEKTINILLKIFRTISKSVKMIFVVNNFSEIDDMSKEFINKVISSPEIINNAVFILTYSEMRSALASVPHDELDENAYTDISIAPFTREQTALIFETYKSLELSIEEKNLINKYSNGNPADFEQFINLAADKNRSGLLLSVPQTLKDVIFERLNILRSDNILTYKILTALAILGQKSNPIILNTFYDIDLEQLELILNKLTNLKFIAPVTNTIYEFKSRRVWALILEECKKNQSVYKEVCEQLFILLQNYHLSSFSVLSYMAKEMNYTQQYLSIWSAGVQIASYIGDTSLFVTAQKQILEIIENNTIKSSDNIKRNIYIQSGKLLESSNPKDALTFLTSALKCEEITKYEEIDLLGYIASCSMKIENYYGVIECIDNVLSKLDNPYSIEYALIKSRKLKALNLIGNFGEVINIAENEVIPVIESTLAKKSSKYKIISETEVFESWLLTLFELSKALTRQGNDRAFKVIAELFKILEANNIQDKQFACNLQLELALANTIKGNIKMSEKILEDIFEIYQNSDVINSFVVSRLNLIGLLNKFFTDRERIEIDELFKIASFADNINDKFTKNISKLILGKIILQTQSAQNAINIYTKQIEYFAKEKNAVGVLLGWYLTAEATALVDKQQALDIASKALSIAQKPEICNHYFALLFDKLICKIYISLKDYDSARIYADRALTIAKGYDIRYQLAKLYIMSGDCLREAADTISDKKEYITKAHQLYQKAVELNKTLDINSLSRTVAQKMNELDILCKANGVVL